MPTELKTNFSGIAVVDNDNFHTDSLTGKSCTDHRTNVMFVQQEHLAENLQSVHPTLTAHGDLKEAVEKTNNITPYKTTNKGLSISRQYFPTAPKTTEEIRTEEMIHTFRRLDSDFGEKLVKMQNIGSFSGFQYLLSDKATKSKPYYYLTFPKAPNKSVIYEVMLRLVGVIKEKNMSFLLLVRTMKYFKK